MIVLTQQRLKERLHYDPTLGWFMWLTRVRASKATPGDVAGHFHDAPSSGYIVIDIEGKKYKAHRLAWLYMTGEWPKHTVDHEDGDKCNNRWKNLRDITHGQNMQAARKDYKNNTSGYRGVHWNPRLKKWRAVIRVGGKGISLGCFSCPKFAHNVYLNAKEKYHGTLR